MFSGLHVYCYPFCYPLTPQKPPQEYRCMPVATLCTKILSRSTVIFMTLALSGVLSNAQVESTTPATIPNTEEFLMDGPHGRKLRIQISHPHPDDPSLSLPIQDQKPVPIFVLDGGLTFGLFSTVTRYMQWGGELPPSLVIGVGYEDEAEAYNENYRLFDFTSANPSYVDYDGNISPEKVGGGEAFREFLLSVLMPKIYETYDVDQENSVLFGHSLGGLFSLETMLEEPDSFGHILALSPSIWFADRRLLTNLEDKLETSFQFSGRLAVLVGEKEERIAGERYKMTSNVLDLESLIANHQSNFGPVSVRVLDDESHHTLLGRAVTLGLQFLISPDRD